MLYAIVGMLVIIFDQVVKYWVDKNINWTEPVREFIPGVVSLCRVQNDGAAFSFLAGGGARIWFIVLTGIFALAVVLALVTNVISGKFGRWCLVLITAGGLSNCIDRIFYGYVLDMFKIELFNFAVFNVADIFITVFAIAFIIYILFGGEKELNEPDEFDEEDKESADRPKRVKKEKKEKVVRRPVAEVPAADDEEPPRKTLPKSKREKPAVEYNYATSDARATGTGMRATMKDKTSSQEFENFFAQKKAEAKAVTEKPKPVIKAEEPKPAVKPVPVKEEPVVDPSDPFAEWDRANSKISGQAAPDVPAPAPRKDFDIPMQTPFDDKPASAKTDSFGTDDFDLDSILNEFK